MKYKVIKTFDWAHRGVEIQSYEAGMPLETDDQDLIDVGLKEGWIEPDAEEKTSVEAKAKSQAPENKSLVGAAKKKLTEFFK